MPVSLHTHSWYSLVEGVTSPAALLERAHVCGYKALALTDTNNLYGAVAFTDLAVRQGVRPILGACLRQHRSRCVALIADPAGYRNLCRILSRLHLAAVGHILSPLSPLGRGVGGEGQALPVREAPPLTPNPSPQRGEGRKTPPGLADSPWSLAVNSSLVTLLAENADGLHVLVDDVVMAERLRDAFGPRLWLEVVRPGAAARPLRHEQELLEAGRRLGLRPVASSAAHFATPEDYATFRLLTAVRRAGLIDQVPPRLSVTPEHHLVSPEVLRRRFRDLPEAVDNTDLLAEQLRSDVLPHDTVLPNPRLPRHLEAVAYLRALCERGLGRRGLAGSLPARQRLREELELIAGGGLADYFLVVREITRYARRAGHSMALRGSAGNSLVCYLLEITDVDPLRFGLSLERFLHAGRPDLPDIDLDFDWKVRDEVLAHVFRRHGVRHTAMISSHLFLQPRSAFREAAKVHGLSNEQITRIADCRLQIADCSDQSAIPADFPLEPERWPRILRDARLLLGRPHHLSVHPGGVVITPRPLEEYVPLQPAPKGILITQFEKDAIEAIGLVKIDLLGNRGLATVDEGFRIADCRLRIADCSDAEPGDSQQGAIVSLLRRGDTLGVTQLESPAMRHLLIQMRPDGLDDVIQTLALVRPGAATVGMKERFIRRRQRREPVPHVHPLLDELLANTQGLMLYEDDALKVVRVLTGLEVPEAYRLCKRLLKCDSEEEERRLAHEFLRLCTARGLGRELVAEQWRQLAKFRHYTFCKSHAVSYGLIAWAAMHLKAHHPLCFWTAVLNNAQGSYPRRVYVEALKREGIELRLPCVNRSEETFAVEGDVIRTGLGAIATLPAELRARLLEERRRGGPYRDLADLRRRLAPGPEALATLIRCGALDGTGKNRPALFLEAELQDRRPDGLAEGLFPTAGPLPGEEWTPADYAPQRRLRDEWELLGFLVGPPLLSLFRPHLPPGLRTSRDLATSVGRRVRLAGMVATARHAHTADGRDMQFITLEDEWGLVEVNLFPGSCPLLAHLELGPYLVTGTVEDHLGVHAITAQSFLQYGQVNGGQPPS